MGFQVSPGVDVNEIDLTTVIPAVSTSIGGFVGSFQWGPVEEITLISSEDKLAQNFGAPTNGSVAVTSTDYLTAAQFLAYTSALKVVRVVGTGALNAVGRRDSLTTPNPVLVKNVSAVLDGIVDISSIPMLAKYPGELGNSIEVAVITTTNSNQAALADELKLFDTAPSGNEVHVVVKDKDGRFTGVPGSVLETYAYLSTVSGSKAPDGSNNFVRDVVNSASKFIFIGDLTAVLADIDGTFIFSSGTAGTAAPTDANIITGWNLFRDSETVDVNLLVVGARTAAVAQHVVQNIAEFRKDCMAFISPLRSDVINNTTPLASIRSFRTALNVNSSYGVLDSGWKYIYNKYQDRFEYVPLCGDTAGLCARTDSERDPWFSPAGFNRGNVKNVIKLAYNPDKTDRDELYKAGINPVVNFQGVGPVLFGDKTLLVRPSAFDRINVRRLFIVLEKAISTAAKFSLFELNDQFTRAQFVSLVEPFLREVQARRGIFDFRVVCDETNNTGEVIDTNRFVGDIYIKPARSINFITLNFVAVRTGVDFAEVVGKF